METGDHLSLCLRSHSPHLRHSGRRTCPLRNVTKLLKAKPRCVDYKSVVNMDGMSLSLVIER